MAQEPDTAQSNFSVLQCMFRRKNGGKPKITGSQDRNFINSANLTVVAVGTHFGYGVYIVSSLVAQNITGPAILASFVIAGLCSVLNGVCFAELSTRSQPFGQSLHNILHQLIGEFSAFLASWLSVLVHTGVIATCARTLSSTLDYISGERLSGYISAKIGVLPLVNSSPDFLAVIIVVVFGIICASNFDINRTLAYLLNILTIFLTVFILLTMLFYSRIDNWFSGTEFVSCGSKSIFTGASMCFYCFVGFEFVLTKGRDSLMSSKSITGIVMISNVACFLFFLGITCSMLAMAPSARITSLAPFLEIVYTSGATWLVYVIAIGTLLALMPVMLHSMASSILSMSAITADGNNCHCCKASQSTHSLGAIIFLGFLAAMMTLFLNTTILLKITALPCLLLNTAVIIVMMLLRFKPDFSDAIGDYQARSSQDRTPDSFNSSKLYKHLENDEESDVDDSSSSEQSETDIDAVVEEYREKIRIASIKNFESPSCSEKERELKRNRARIARWILITIIILIFVTCLLAGFAYDLFLEANVGFIAVIATSSAFIMISTIVLTLRADYQNIDRVVFRVPLVPAIPVAGLILHAFLIAVLPWQIMAMVVLWVAIGAATYFSCLSINKCRPMITAPSIDDEERILLQPLPSYSSNLPQPPSFHDPVPSWNETTEDITGSTLDNITNKPISYNVKSVQIP